MTSTDSNAHTDVCCRRCDQDIVFYADVSAGPEAPWVVLVHDDNIPEAILKQKSKKGKNKSKKAGNKIGTSELLLTNASLIFPFKTPDNHKINIGTTKLPRIFT